MKERILKRLQRIGNCCKNTTKGKMRFLYRRKILIGKLDKPKMNFPKIQNAWSRESFEFGQNLKSIKVKFEIN